MSETPPSGPPTQGASGFPPAPAPTGFPAAPAGPPSWPTAPPKPSRWLTYVALAVALIASGLAVVGWFRPPPPPRAAAPSYTEKQIADAKARACNAFELVRTGTTLQARGGDPGGEPSDDPAMRKAQAANARLSLVAGSWYLRDHVDPATPAPLTAAIQKLAAVLLDIGVNYLAGAKNADPPQAALLNEGESRMTQVEELCK
jgi:hypothetical protein